MKMWDGHTNPLKHDDAQVLVTTWNVQPSTICSANISNENNEGVREACEPYLATKQSSLYTNPARTMRITQSGKTMA